MIPGIADLASKADFTGSRPSRLRGFASRRGALPRQIARQPAIAARWKVSVPWRCHPL